MCCLILVVSAAVVSMGYTPFRSPPCYGLGRLRRRWQAVRRTQPLSTHLHYDRCSVASSQGGEGLPRLPRSDPPLDRTAPVLSADIRGIGLTP